MEAKIIQFTAAKGPAECAWVVAKVLKLFLKELGSNKIAYQILHKEKGIENTTVQSVMLRIKGNQISEFLENWIGTIQWVGTSTFRKFNKRKNWFIGCYEIKQIEEVKLMNKDIQFQAIRSSGPGGQHVNKVSSAIRATHKPSNTQVLVMESRSQHQNKKIAIQRLREKVENHNMMQLQEQVKEKWGNHLNLERGNPVQIFTGTDFKPKRVKQPFKNKRKALKSDLQKQLKNKWEI